MSPEQLTIHASPRTILGQLRMTDLQPGPLVNHLFSQLVAASLSLKELPGDMSPAMVNELRQLCSAGESNMEQFWAERIVSDPNKLAEFPYLENYLELTYAEYEDVVRALGRKPERWAFMGSGPLPLTALVLQKIDPMLQIDCIDIDDDALASSHGVVTALLGTDNRIRTVNADAANFDYAAYDVVTLAALVGLGASQKSLVLDQVAASMRSDAVLAARSVPDDGRKLLYPRIEELPASLSLISETTPPPGVINNLVLSRRADA